jgi:hypothetical protein
VIINAIGVAHGLAIFLYNSYKKPLKSLIPKLDVTTNCSISTPVMKAASLDRDYLPDPPTPINKALPTGKSKILEILQI